MTGKATKRLSEALSRIASDNSRLSIVTALDEQGARDAAKDSDARHRAGKAFGPLDGLLLGIKDNIAVAGLPWTAGLGARRQIIADKDASCVAKLRAAGAIPFVMLNMHEAALGATTDNPHFGRCLNPLDEKRTPGGSSGGSGAAIAAGFCDITLGTDTMGSVRIPAAYCGVAGLKPTNGLIARDGLVLLSPSLDTIGPLASDVATLRAMIFVMGRDQPVGCSDETGRICAHAKKIGVPRQILETGCEEPVLKGLETAIKVIESAAIEVVDVDLPQWNPSRARRSGLLVSEAEGAIELKDILEREEDDLMSEGLRDLLSYGANASAEKMVAAHEEIRVTALACQKSLESVDLLLMPTAPQLPFKHDDIVPANQADLTALANFYGGPALSIPVKSLELTSAVQLLGPANSESLVLSTGEVLEMRLRP
jgi:aspartyl-tRNA(Asn)/glutamyl-tRNA(Gln) amidotransferase subunit A